jgi:hypothetical protein
MRMFLLTLVILGYGLIMFMLGDVVKEKHLNKTIVLTLKDKELPPSEGDLLRVQYVDGKKIYLCIID